MNIQWSTNTQHPPLVDHTWSTEVIELVSTQMKVKWWVQKLQYMWSPQTGVSIAKFSSISCNYIWLILSHLAAAWRGYGHSHGIASSKSCASGLSCPFLWIQWDGWFPVDTSIVNSGLLRMVDWPFWLTTVILASLAWLSFPMISFWTWPSFQKLWWGLSSLTIAPFTST